MQRDTDSHAAGRARNERGVALIITLMTLMLLSALGMGLIVITTGEGALATNNRDSSEAFYAADAVVERVMQDLLLATDWNGLLQGSTQSPFLDGPPSGTKQLPNNAGTIDLTALTNQLNCGKLTTCSVSEMNAATRERPWAVNNPRWTPYAYGPATDLIETGTISSPFYVVVWVGDDPRDSDNNPLLDGGVSANAGYPTNRGAGVISLRAEAFGPNGAHRVIETTVARTDSTEIERGYTSQRGQDEQNRRARKASVQTPGKALTRNEIATVP